MLAAPIKKETPKWLSLILGVFVFLHFEMEIYKSVIGV